MLRSPVIVSLLFLTVSAYSQPVAKTSALDVSIPPRLAQNMGWEALRRGIQDSDAQHRKQAIAAAGTIGPVHGAVQMVEGCLQDKDEGVRQISAAT